MNKGIFRVFLAVLLTLSFLLPAGPATADAAMPLLSQLGIYDYAMVTGSETLNLRSGPGQEYDWLGRSLEGDWIGIRGESGNWYSVYVLSTGKTGYMSKNFLRRSGEDQSSSGQTVSVSTGVVNNPNPRSFLNLRQYPSLSAPVLGIFYNGASFTVLSTSQDGWVQAQINGLTGYFRQEYVRIGTSAGGGSRLVYVNTPNLGSVNLRDAPTYVGSTVIAQCPQGLALPVILGEKRNTFWKVSYNGTIGYIDSSFLSSTPVASSAPASGSSYGTPSSGSSSSSVRPVTHGTAVVHNPRDTQVLNLRAQPSTASRVIAQYRNGIRFEVIEPGETWTKVYGSASGNIGYFMTKYLTLSGVSSSPTKKVQNGNSYVNLRSAPNTQTSTVYSQVPSGATVTVLTPGDAWTQVRYNGTVGYMMTSFLH